MIFILLSLLIAGINLGVAFSPSLVFFYIGFFLSLFAGILFGYIFDNVYKDKRWIETIRKNIGSGSIGLWLWGRKLPKSTIKTARKIYGYFLKLAIINFLFLIPIQFLIKDKHELLDINGVFIIFSVFTISFFAMGTLGYFWVVFFIKYRKK